MSNKPSDLTGQTFGRLTALHLERDPQSKQTSPRWRCRCRCGKETTARANVLRLGQVKSCGCLLRERPWSVQAKDKTGLRFGHLTAIAPTRSLDGRPAWICRCDCGRTATVRVGQLGTNTKSCGCGQPARRKEAPAREGGAQGPTAKEDPTSGKHRQGAITTQFSR